MMRYYRSLRVIIACVWTLFPVVALAQSSPNLIYNQIPTAGQWNSFFQAKQDVLGYVPLNTAGGIMTGKLITTASTTTQAGFNIPAGAAPTTPVNGDIWATTAGVFAQTNGSTVGPFIASGSIPAGGSNGQIQYNNSGTLGGFTLGGDCTFSNPNITCTKSNTVSVPSSGTSGGIPYYSSTSAISSSAALTANQIVIGGGPAVAPTTFACPTGTTIVHGGTPPTCGQLVNGDITTNTIANASLAQASAATLKGNTTSGTANVADFTIQGLTNLASPNQTLDFLVIYDHAAGTLKSVTPSAIAGSVGSVTSVANSDGSLTISPTTGAVVASIALGHANTWSALQTFNNSDIAMVGSSTGTTTLTSDNAGASNFTVHLPAVNSTLYTQADTATNTQIWSATANKVVDAAGTNNSLNPVALTDASIIALDMSTFINGTVTLGGNRTLGNPTNTQAGRCGFIVFTQDGTGTRTLAYSSNWKFVNAVAPVLSTAIGAKDQLNYCVVDSTHIDAAMMNNVK